MGDIQPVSDDSAPREVARPSDSIIGGRNVADHLLGAVAATNADRRSTDVLFRYAMAAKERGLAGHVGSQGDAENIRVGPRPIVPPKPSSYDAENRRYLGPE